MINRVAAGGVTPNIIAKSPMNRVFAHAPSLLAASVIVALALHGPISQWPDYHRFADTRPLLGLPNAMDVLSNLGFAVVAMWGWIGLAPRRRDPRLAPGWPGWALFLVALLMTAIGSALYHLSPDNFRLLFDRLPIALACAGLLAAVYTETHRSAHGLRTAAVLALASIASVLWWYVTELTGAGDLRPYLLIQAGPLVLIPLWQAIHGSPRVERVTFGLAIAGYLLAKVAELQDQQVFDAVGFVSGHTLKHMLAFASAALLVGGVKARLSASQRGSQ
jgi:hypothetical protein